MRTPERRPRPHTPAEPERLVAVASEAQIRGQTPFGIGNGGCMVWRERIFSPVKVAGRQMTCDIHFEEEVEMALSDQLTKLAARAKEAEDNAAAAHGKAKADLEQDVETARATSQADADRLRESADANKNKISAWWSDVQRSWSEHIATVRDNIDSKKAEHDLDRAQSKADNAEDDARSQSTTRMGRSRKPSTRCSMRPLRGWRPTSSRGPARAPEAVKVDSSGLPGEDDTAA